MRSLVSLTSRYANHASKATTRSGSARATVMREMRAIRHGTRAAIAKRAMRARAKGWKGSGRKKSGSAAWWAQASREARIARKAMVTAGGARKRRPLAGASAGRELSVIAMHDPARSGGARGPLLRGSFGRLARLRVRRLRLDNLAERHQDAERMVDGLRIGKGGLHVGLEDANVHEG